MKIARRNLMTLSKKNTRLLKKAGVFTLLEILVAMTIMAMGLGTIFYMVGGASRDLIRAQKMWARQHQLSNACEYFLLCGPDSNLPSDLLPYGYRAFCEYEIYEDIPEGSIPNEAPLFAFENDIKGWYLALYTVTLYDPAGNEIGTQKIEKIVRDED